VGDRRGPRACIPQAPNGGSRARSSSDGGSGHARPEPHVFRAVPFKIRWFACEPLFHVVLFQTRWFEFWASRRRRRFAQPRRHDGNLFQHGQSYQQAPTAPQPGAGGKQLRIGSSCADICQVGAKPSDDWCMGLGDTALGQARPMGCRPHGGESPNGNKRRGLIRTRPLYDRNDSGAPGSIRWADMLPLLEMAHKKQNKEAGDFWTTRSAYRGPVTE